MPRWSSGPWDDDKFVRLAAQKLLEILGEAAKQIIDSWSPSSQSSDGRWDGSIPTM